MPAVCPIDDAGSQFSCALKDDSTVMVPLPCAIRNLWSDAWTLCEYPALKKLSPSEFYSRISASPDALCLHQVLHWWWKNSDFSDSILLHLLADTSL